MTSNAVLLPQLAGPLKAAGLTRINIHVDTFHPERLKKIMRFGSLEEIEAGIAAAEAAGLRPIKINVRGHPRLQRHGRGGRRAPRPRARLAGRASSSSCPWAAATPRASR